jgi:DNA-binding MarR family transcriptional regulator
MPSTRVSALRSLIDETRRLFHRLAAAADAAHADLGVSASQRAILETLARDGAQSVPHIARAKRVSRQHIQVLVNTLAEAGLVVVRTNPAHRRSPLVELSPEGARRFGEVAAREREILSEWALHLRTTELEAAAGTLRGVGEVVERASKRGRSRAS